MIKPNKILIAILAILLVALLLLIPSVDHYEREQEKVVPKKDVLDLYIDRLANEFECVNCPDNFRHMDLNGKYSYSCLQFQENTFLLKSHDYKIYGSIYDCNFQKKLARAMFENDPSAWRHWRTSVERGLGMPPVDN